MNLTLIDAFGRLGAKPGKKHGALSAIAADGLMVLNCEQPVRMVVTFFIDGESTE